MDVDHSHVVAMAEAARHAPSVHNTQPWRLLSRPDGLVVAVDDRRALPVLDPTGRLRSISCGAAVANAALASRARGFSTRVQLLPDGRLGSAVARLVVVGPRTPTAAELRLAEQIAHRRTHRVVHPDDTVPDTLLDDLSDTVADEGAGLTVLDLPARRVLARLLLRAARQQERRPDLLGETREWLREPTLVRRGGVTDGVLRGSLATAPRGVGASTTHDLDVLTSSQLGSTVVTVSTLTDTRRDHVVTGIAVQHMLLHLSALDLVAAFADQATEVPDTRDQLSGLLARPGQVQLVLQLGRALVDVRVPPRRRLDDVLDGRTAGSPQAVIDLTTHERTRS